MSKEYPLDIGIKVAWGLFMRKGLFSDAILAVHLMKQYAHASEDIKLSQSLDKILEKTLEEAHLMLPGTPVAQPHVSDDRCSFCGARSNDVKLGAGPGVFICENCVSTFSQVLTSRR